METRKQKDAIPLIRWNYSAAQRVTSTPYVLSHATNTGCDERTRPSRWSPSRLETETRQLVSRSAWVSICYLPSFARFLRFSQPRSQSVVSADPFFRLILPFCLFVCHISLLGTTSLPKFSSGLCHRCNRTPDVSRYLRPLSPLLERRSRVSPACLASVSRLSFILRRRRRAHCARNVGSTWPVFYRAPAKVRGMMNAFPQTFPVFRFVLYICFVAVEDAWFHMYWEIWSNDLEI